MTKQIAAVWLGGSGRSGTTWLSRIMTSLPRSTLVFEPLHPILARPPKNLVPIIDRSHRRAYLRPAQEAPTWYQVVS
jgi:hypothetical protein